MTTTQADSAHALGMPPARVETPATGAPSRIIATSLKVGDRIRDRGDLHTIDEIEHDPQSYGCMVVIMEDGGRLGIPPHEHVWRY